MAGTFLYHNANVGSRRGTFQQICPSLPKTRSGKIMRRILRKVAADETDNLGDISTLADPAVVEDLVSRHRTLKSNHLNKAMTSKLQCNDFDIS